VQSRDGVIHVQAEAIRPLCAEQARSKCPRRIRMISTDYDERAGSLSGFAPSNLP